MPDWRCRAVFTRVFHWSRPRSVFGFAAQPSLRPQTFPRDFIAAAIKAGAAIPVQKQNPRRKRANQPLRRRLS